MRILRAPACILALMALSGACASDGGGGGTASSATTSAALEVLMVSPADGSIGVSVQQAIDVLLSGEIEASSVGEATVQLHRAGSEVACVRSVSGARIAVRPRIALLPLTRYELHLTDGVRATDGRLLEASSIAFTTGAGPTTRGPLLTAGIGLVDLTPAVGVPLGGYGARRLPASQFDLNPATYHTMFTPSTGVRDPIYAKALVLDDGVDRIAILTTDLIASDARANAEVARKLAQRGVQLDPSRIMTCASHTHSGPGAMSESLFWAYAALDFYKAPLFDQLTTGMADAIEQAVSSLRPARLGVGGARLPGVTANRRAGLSPHLTPDSVDDDLGVIRVDGLSGYPIATVYNFAVHVSAFGPSNTLFSADLAGDASRRIEASGGGLALFVNGAEGDIKPAPGIGSTSEAESQEMGRRLADAVLNVRWTTPADADVDIDSVSRSFDMGQPAITVASSQAGAPAFLLNVLAAIPVPVGAVSVPLGPQMMERRFRFQAVRIQDAVLTSVPGEAVHEIGLELKAEGARLGFARTFVMGLANGHMSYIANEREYRVGGYEAFGTLFGPKTGERVVQNCATVMGLVKP